ncbi:GDSL-type esterase/lipase family protein [Botrimarina sp.]|uniref:GDSL-type esterase/lipase family protein n=1 Tax=Botrimarina sp. TaxID=2795802 RepID=UPI0032F09380
MAPGATAGPLALAPAALALLLVAIAAVAVAEEPKPSAAAPPSAPNTAVLPAPLEWDRFDRRCRALAQRAATERPRVLFLGDSITERWSTVGQAVWRARFEPLGAANFGVVGDRTQSLLWRFDHGGYARMAPEVVVLLIGTNNVKNGRNSPSETAEGVAEVVRTLRLEMPTSRVLLLSVLPCGESSGAPHRRAAAEVNRRLAAVADSPCVDLLDCTALFVDAEGRIPDRWMADKLHPTEEGYRRLADALEPAVRRLACFGPRRE